MSFRNLSQTVEALRQEGQLRDITLPLSARLEMPTLARLVYQNKGPALLFHKVEGSPFKALSNLYGSAQRTEFLFKDSLPRLQRLFEIASDPSLIFKKPLSSLHAATLLSQALPRPVWGKGALSHHTQLNHLPAVTSWPKDGGPFITLPQVYSEDPTRPSLFTSNTGMYRIQISGNSYESNKELGLHYQIHRGLGGHHAKSLEIGKKLKISIWVGGPPAHALAAVMPLPENLPEVLFAGLMGNRAFRYQRRDGYIISQDADFCILGEVELDQTKPEGPFGDHLGYYSLIHEMPLMKVKQVLHRKNAIWPFTVVGRPPQEDTEFGHLIHSLTASLIPKVLPGIKAVHAVDEAGVHPLLLALGSERYVPYMERKPRELHTLAHSLLGYGQLSLAKIVMLCAHEDDPTLSVNDIPKFFQHFLERFIPEEDLHFITRTTMDTLDYSGTALNQGSKLIMLAAGRPRRTLTRQLPASLTLPSGFFGARLVLPGILALTAPAFTASHGRADQEVFCNFYTSDEYIGQWEGIPLIILCDDSQFMADSVSNFLWATYTRTDPAPDILGIRSFVAGKHWGCRGPLVFDARIKPHHAPVLEEDPATLNKLFNLAKKNGPLEGLL